MRYVKGWLQSSETDTVNGRRTEILKKCIRDGEKDKDLHNLETFGKWIGNVRLTDKLAREIMSLR